MDKDIEVLAKNIEKCGDKYIENELKSPQSWLCDWDYKKLETDWWEALKFFLDHTFRRGRDDNISSKYYNYAIMRLKKIYNINIENIKAHSDYFGREWIKEKRKGNANIFSFKKDKRVVYEQTVRELFQKNTFLREYLEKDYFSVNPNGTKRTSEGIEYLVNNNVVDIMMLMDTLKLVSKIDDGNIYTYLLDIIEKNGIKKAYMEISNKNEKGIFGVGDKLASFIIRDIVLLNLNKKLFKGIANAYDDENIYTYLFPVDTHVKTLAKKLGYSGREHPEDIKKFLINVAEGYNLNIPKFAAGIWYTETHNDCNIHL